MSSLADLSPSSLWHWFEEICAIPHPSKHEHNLSAHIVRWAAEKGISCRQDPTGNLILKKPATSGMSDRKGVVLQAHLDMVPQKTADKTFDFTLDAIHAYIEGDWVTADGTTLGADNGIGLASTLAILGSSDIPHGPLEALLTVDEETGMTGAFGLAPNELDADILINTDSEQEGEIYMGCAGGESATITLSLDRQPLLASSSGKTYEVVISGLKGGHSGCDIHLGRANANKLLGRFLFEASGAMNLQLCEVQGGSLPNAIPRDARATFVIAEEQKIALERQLADFQAIVQIELEQV